jgi:exopolysaccharide biosynthesis polyprenyl glycosylphosphotransferase
MASPLPIANLSQVDLPQATKREPTTKTMRDVISLIDEEELRLPETETLAGPPNASIPAGENTAQPYSNFKNRKRIFALLFADLVAASLAGILASAVRFEFLRGSPADGLNYQLLSVVLGVGWVAFFWIYGLYEPRRTMNVVAEIKQLFHGIAAGSVMLLAADSFVGLDMAAGWVLGATVFAFVIIGTYRLVVRKIIHYLHRRGRDITRVIIVGTNDEAQTIARTVKREAWLGYEIIGFVSEDLDPRREGVEGCEIIGGLSELDDLILQHQANLVLVASSDFEMTTLNRLFWDLRRLDVDLQITSGAIDFMASRVVVQSVGGMPLLYVRRNGMERLQRGLNRLLDICGALFGLLVFAPVFAAIALWIKRDSKGGVLFTQTRTGRDGKPFKLYKFRTMVQDAEALRAELEHLSEGPGFLFKLKEDPRITRPGHFLRKYSLDELPQLINVLRGEMSLVGPRPALPAEVEQYDEWIKNRLLVRPGMTGLWQVSGRTSTEFSDYVRFDLFYIQNWSLSLDLWILWRTIRAVVVAEGAA